MIEITADIIAETKSKICDEFIGRFHEFISDVTNLISGEMTEFNFGKKYGFTFRTPEIAKKHIKENLTNIAFFQKNVFCGKYTKGWENSGYNIRVVWKLKDEGFLSYDYNYSSRARADGKTDFFYISQETAKKIFKEYKESVKA